MGASYVARQVARANRNLLLVNGGILAVLLLFAVFMALGALAIANSHDRLAAFAAEHRGPGTGVSYGDISHPVRVSPADLSSDATLRGLSGRAVALTDPAARDLHFPVSNWIERAPSSSQIHMPPTYMVSDAGGSALLIIPASPNARSPFTGVIRPLPEFDRGPASGMLMSQGMRDGLLSYELDALSVETAPARKGPAVEMHPVGGAQSGSPIPLLFAVAFVVLPAWNVCKAVGRIRNPLSHPIYKRLAVYGPPAEVARAIDAERQQWVQAVPPAEFTQNWMMAPSLWDMEVVNLDHIVWVFPRQTRLNLIPVLNSLGLLDRHGKGHFVYTDRGHVDAILDYIKRSRPWVITGYDRALAERYSHDRARLVAEVDTRRTGTRGPI